jgi:hypothetical protein
MTVQCPNCSHSLKPDLHFYLKDASLGIDLCYVPERDRSKALTGDLAYATDQARELVIGYPELVEKLTIAKRGFDPRAIEVLKYSLLSSALDAAEGGADIRIRFHNLEQEKLVFYIEGLKEGEIGVSSIPIESYEKVTANLKEIIEKEPFASLLAPPYISVNKIYSEDQVDT